MQNPARERSGGKRDLASRRGDGVAHAVFQRIQILGTVRPIWARLLIAATYVAPAAVAGFHATHGIVKHTMPSEGWQMVFSVIGAVAVGIAAFARIAGMTADTSSAGRMSHA